MYHGNYTDRISVMIKLKNVSVDIKGKNILSDINLTVGKGEFVLLCGESGCGKTTMTKLINGLIPCCYAVLVK